MTVTLPDTDRLTNCETCYTEIIYVPKAGPLANFCADHRPRQPATLRHQPETPVLHWHVVAPRPAAPHHVYTGLSFATFEEAEHLPDVSPCYCTPGAIDVTNLPRTRDQLGYGTFGNGVVVWDRTREEHGDYMKLALVDHDRLIHWYPGANTPWMRTYVERIAFTGDCSRSYTQPDSVFTRPAPGHVAYARHLDGDHAACPVVICPDGTPQDDEEATCRHCRHTITWCPPQGYTNLREWCDGARSAACWRNGYEGHEPLRTARR